MSCEASVCPLTGRRVRPRSNTTNFWTAEKYCSLSLVFSTSTSCWKLLLAFKSGGTVVHIRYITTRHLFSKKFIKLTFL